MRAPHKHFHNCPACGEPLAAIVGKSMSCRACQFTYFFNPTIGLAGFIENGNGEILLIERGRDPAKGKLAPPGGFADVDETAEEALTREVFEETGLRIKKWKYLSSAVNHYTYKEVTYPVLDFFYTAKTDEKQKLKPCSEETNGVCWIPKASIDPASLAFPSMQDAFLKFLEIDPVS